METKHTPGKWYQSHRPIPNDEDGMYSTQVYTEDGETIATISWYPKPKSTEIIDGKEVSVIGTYREANAKLIAAAPDLLDALLKLQYAVKHGNVKGLFDDEKQVIDNAILKATT